MVPNGGEIRRMRRDRGWSRRAFVNAIARASLRESGLPSTITVNLLEHIEESNEPVPYTTLCLVASGLDCNPVEILTS